MQTITLNNKHTMPALGYGTWNLSTDVATESVVNAIAAGYRHIDCAMIYGNEKEIGQGLERAFSKGMVTREELFITSKLWNTDHAPKDAVAACRKTLADLKVDCLDLYLIHWGVSFEHGDDPEPLDKNGLAKFSLIPIQETWHALEKLVEEGLVKSIGVANFNALMLLDILSYAKIKPVMNQIELHPYHTQSKLVDFCQSQGIALTAYSPLGSTGAPILRDDAIKTIADEHACSPAQVALAWGLQRGTAVIPMSSNEDRIKENMGAGEVTLTADEMQRIAALDKRKPLVDPQDWWGFPYFS